MSHGPGDSFHGAMQTVGAIAIILSVMAPGDFSEVNLGVALGWMGDRLNEATAYLMENAGETGT